MIPTKNILPPSVIENIKRQILGDKEYFAGCKLKKCNSSLIEKAVIAKLIEVQLFSSNDDVCSYELELEYMGHLRTKKVIPFQKAN